MWQWRACLSPGDSMQSRHYLNLASHLSVQSEQAVAVTVVVDACPLNDWRRSGRHERAERLDREALAGEIAPRAGDLRGAIAQHTHERRSERVGVARDQAMRAVAQLQPSSRSRCGDDRQPIRERL